MRLTPAEAKALGLTKGKARTTRKTLPRAGAMTRCCTCGEEFTTDAAETRHVSDGHNRFAFVHHPA